MPLASADASETASGPPRGTGDAPAGSVSVTVDATGADLQQHRDAVDQVFFERVLRAH
jgi:hypothetical protein